MEGGEEGRETEEKVGKINSQILTLVSDLTNGGDKRWGLTPDPRDERFAALAGLVIFNHLDLNQEGVIEWRDVQGFSRSNTQTHKQTQTHTNTQFGQPFQTNLLAAKPIQKQIFEFWAKALISQPQLRPRMGAII